MIIQLYYIDIILINVLLIKKIKKIKKTAKLHFKRMSVRNNRKKYDVKKFTFVDFFDMFVY